jgi:hypothetical protein
MGAKEGEAIVEQARNIPRRNHAESDVTPTGPLMVGRV